MRFIITAPLKTSLTIIMILINNIDWSQADLLAYDCAHPMANRTKINMLGSAPCVFEDDDDNVQLKTIYLVQPKEYYKIHVKQCKISIIRDINDCSTFSDNKVLGGFLSYIKETTYEECLQMHRFHSTKIGNTEITGLKSNGSIHSSLVLAGKIYANNGGCKGGSWSDGTSTWEDVYVTAAVTISLKDYWTQAEVGGYTVKLQSGYDCKLSDQSCMDPENGFTIWDESHSRESCERENYELVYFGPANKTSVKTNEGTSILYSVYSDTSFSLMIKTSTHVCGHKAFQTEHPKLKILEHEGFNLEFTRTNDVFNLNLFTYINSKFTFLERHTKVQLNNLHKALLTNQCELDKSILNTQLALAFSSPSDFAYLRMGKPGYTALPAGEVMYLVKCQAVPVKRRFLDKCYQEFPVEYKNSTWFMSPRTHILVLKGNEIPCSEIVPVNYNIENKWYSFSPKIHETLEPTSVVPKSESGWKYSDPVPLINSGLYSLEDLESMRKQLMFPLDRGAAMSAFSNRISQNSENSNTFNFKELIDENEIQSSLDKLMSKTTGFLSIFGSYASIVIGFWMVFKIGKIIADFIFHLVSLYREFGLNVRLSAAVWDTLSSHLVTKSQITKTKKDSADNNSTVANINTNLMMRPINEVQPTAPLISKDKKVEDEEKTSTTLYPNINPRQHIRVHFKPEEEISSRQIYMCINNRSEFKIVVGGLIIKTPNGTKDYPNHKVLGVYDCTCPREKFVEHTMNQINNYGEEVMC